MLIRFYYNCLRNNHSYIPKEIYDIHYKGSGVFLHASWKNCLSRGFSELVTQPVSIGYSSWSRLKARVLVSSFIRKLPDLNLKLDAACLKEKSHFYSFLTFCFKTRLLLSSPGWPKKHCITRLTLTSQTLACFYYLPRLWD